MASFNKVILMGNLTRDPELRMSSQGTAICKFSLAVSRVYTAQDGTRKEEATFVDVDSFGKQAETIAKYMVKGRPLLVEGRLKLDQWETQAGEKRSKLGVVVESFQFIGSKPSDEGGHSGGSDEYAASAPAPRRAAAAPAAAAIHDIDDDVPF